MHGCGNDYVYVDTIGGPPLPPDVDLPRLAAKLSDRHFGVGGDGLIIIERAPSGRLAMRMFNSDGCEGEMCGNGMRCLAAYAFEQGYTEGPSFEVETKAGLIRPSVTPAPGPGRRSASVTVDLGPPREIRTGVDAAGFQGVFVSMGNPHFVVTVPDISKVELERVGPILERAPVFPQRANVEFVQVLSPGRLRMRVWERSSGITLACGTGAAASVVALATTGLAPRRAVVVLDGGELSVDWTDAGSVLITGPTEEVFRTDYTGELPRLEE